MIERRTWEDGQLRVERQRLLNKYRASDSKGEAYCSISSFRKSRNFSQFVWFLENLDPEELMHTFAKKKSCQFSKKLEMSTAEGNKLHYWPFIALSVFSDARCTASYRFRQLVSSMTSLIVCIDLGTVPSITNIATFSTCEQGVCQRVLGLLRVTDPSFNNRIRPTIKHKDTWPKHDTAAPPVASNILHLLLNSK